MRRFLLIALLLITFALPAEAAKLISCLSDSGQTCTASLVSISSTTPTTIWTDQPLTEIADPGAHGKSDYVAEYGSDLNPALEYRVFCNCSVAGSWSYAYEPYETGVLPIKAQTAKGNERQTYVLATVANATRKVGVGKIDYVKYETKADDAADWSSPTSTKYLYFWYTRMGDINPYKIGENN